MRNSQNFSQYFHFITNIEGIIRNHYTILALESARSMESDVSGCRKEGGKVVPLDHSRWAKRNTPLKVSSTVILPSFLPSTLTAVMTFCVQRERERGGSSKINANLIFESYEIKTLLYLLSAHNCRGGCGNRLRSQCNRRHTIKRHGGGGGGSRWEFVEINQRGRETHRRPFTLNCGFSLGVLRTTIVTNQTDQNTIQLQ